MTIRRITTAGAGVLALAVVVLSVGAPASAAPTLTNPGFESGVSQNPSGWSESGTVSASKTEAGGHSGSVQLAHWASSAYTVETYQTLTGLAPGQYTLTAWVRSGGGQSQSYIQLRNCGGTTARTTMPASGGTWRQISVTTIVTGSTCTAGIYSQANADNWINADDLTFGPTGGGGSTIQIRGADISSRPKNEANGAVYVDSGGVQRDAITILRNAGVNYARLKVWVNPADGYNNKARVLAMATRIKAAGMNLASRPPPRVRRTRCERSTAPCGTCPTGAAWVSSTGSRRGRSVRGQGGIRRTPTRATNGRTRPCSISTTGCCPR